MAGRPLPPLLALGVGRSGLAAAVLSMLLCCAAPTATLAHGTARAIEEWGPFLPGDIACLRTMTQVTHECFDTVLDIEQRCQDARARGGTCDTDAAAGQTTAAVNAMLATVMGSCTAGQLTEVGYLAFFDAEADLFNACALQARAAVAAAYAPASPGPSSEDAAACMAASAAYGRKVMRFTLERERPVFERFASRLYDPTVKPGIIRQMETDLSVTRPRWITGLLEACPQFETLYGRTAESFLRTLKQRTDCVLSKTYVTSVVLCIAQVCGNGIVEGDEQCDDGNGDDTDACHNDCTATARTPAL